MVSPLITDASTNVTGVYELFLFISDEVSPSFFPLILFGLYIITFIISKGFTEENSKAFAGMSFFGMILSILLTALGFLSNTYMYLSITLVGISIVWLHLENRPYV